jgi:hypothetical protein
MWEKDECSGFWGRKIVRQRRMTMVTAGLMFVANGYFLGKKFEA